EAHGERDRAEAEDVEEVELRALGAPQRTRRVPHRRTDDAEAEDPEEVVVAPDRRNAREEEVREGDEGDDRPPRPEGPHVLRQAGEHDAVDGPPREPAGEGRDDEGLPEAREALVTVTRERGLLVGGHRNGP